MRGRVIANFGQRLAVRNQAGEMIQCNSLRRFGLLVSGDWIEYQQQNNQSYVIKQVFPRRSSLERPDRRGRPKPLAANIDQLLVVVASIPAPDWVMVSAYLVYAMHHGLKAALVLNKSDLFATQGDNNFLDTANIYTYLDYPVIKTSCKSGAGINELKKILTGHTSVLVGQSGVGKSSIVKQLLPDQQIQINAVSAATGQGSHTTTTTMLYQCNNGGELIDSPGVRQFSIVHLPAESIRKGFIEFNEYSDQCQFANCSHIQEPGCAVIAAVEEGSVVKQRWQHYKELLNRAI